MSNYPPSGGYPPQQGAYPPQLQAGQQGGGYPGQQQYQAYPGASPAQYGQHPQQQQGQYQPNPQQPQYGGQPYGQYPGATSQQQPQYGGGTQQANPQEVATYKRLLESTIAKNGLQYFYPPGDQRVDAFANAAPMQVSKFTKDTNVPVELARDVVKLALYDLVLLIDDSGSMEFQGEDGRQADLKQILDYAVQAAMLFDYDGISIRFLNWSPRKLYPGEHPQPGEVTEDRLNGIKDKQSLDFIMNNISFRGLTPLGTSMERKIVNPFFRDPAGSNTLRKPVLVIAITDGQPEGDGPQGNNKDEIYNTLQLAAGLLQSMPQYGKRALSFQFAQVGNDKRATDYLAKLDKDFGDFVDVTSNFETESAQTNDPHFRKPQWIMKMLMGAIDSSYDKSDEQGPAGGQGAGRPPPGQYNAPPPNQYGGYSQSPYPPQQQQYQQGSGNAQPGGYGQQGYGQHPPQQSYGQPPQQGYQQQPSSYGSQYGQQGGPQGQGRPPQPGYNPSPGPGYGQTPYGQQSGQQGQGQPPYPGSYAPPPPRRY